MSSDKLSQDEAICQFCSVTGADDERAKGLLEACDWNLELAINMHVDTDDGRNNKASSSNSSAGPSTAHPAVNPDLPIRFRRQDDPVRAPIPPVRQVLVQHPAARSGTSSEVYDAFRDFQAEAQWQEHELEEGESTAASNDTKTSLEELFRPPLELIFRGSFMGARDAGSQQNRWLLVNVQNGKEFNCQTLNRDVWSHQTVKDILKEHFVFWQVYHDSFEGVRYSQFYKVTSYPHVSIIDPRTGEQMKSWGTTIDYNSFCDTVLEFLTEHPCSSLTCLV